MPAAVAGDAVAGAAVAANMKSVVYGAFSAASAAISSAVPAAISTAVPAAGSATVLAAVSATVTCCCMLKHKCRNCFCHYRSIATSECKGERLENLRNRMLFSPSAPPSFLRTLTRNLDAPKAAAACVQVSRCETVTSEGWEAMGGGGAGAVEGGVGGGNHGMHGFTGVV